MAHNGLDAYIYPVQVHEKYLARGRSGIIFRLLLASILLPCHILRGQQLGGNRLPPDTYALRVLSTKDGLPQNSIFSITQSSDGYLWFGTEEGFARYDGSEIHVYSKSNLPLPSNVVLKLSASKDNSLWIQTLNGIARFQADSLTLLNEGRDLPGKPYCFYKTDSDSVWIGTSAGLVKLTGEAAYLDSSQLTHSITSITQDIDGSLLLVTGDRVYSKRLGTYLRLPSLDGYKIQSLLIAHDSTVWIGTAVGLFSYRDNVTRVYKRANGLPSDWVNALFQDSNGHIWVGTTDGIVRIVNGTLESFSLPRNIPRAEILCFFEDHEGSVWAGTNGSGAIQIYRSIFRELIPKGRMMGNFIRSLSQSESGEMFVGSARGLSILRRQKDNWLVVKTLLAHNEILALYEDGAGSLWIGTRSRGLFKYSHQLLTSYSSSVPIDHVHSILQLRDKTLLVGGTSGLAHLDVDKVNFYSVISGNVPGPVRTIHESQDGTIWVGTQNGLMKISAGTGALDSAKVVLPGEHIIAILEDNENNLWIGTYGGGIYLIRGESEHHFRMRDGLFDDVAYCIIEDGLGYLWMSCNRGVYRVRKADLLEFSQSGTKKIESQSFGILDGMPSSECNSGFPSGIRTREGLLWFATTEGIAIANPEKTGKHSVKLPVHIINMLADRVPVHLEENVTLSPGRNDIEFRFRGLSFIPKNRLQYDYYLEGFAKDWINVGSSETVFLANLPPGPYTLKVRARNSVDEFYENEAAISFTILPYFYQTTWFIVLIISVSFILLLGAALFYMEYVERGKKAIQLEARLGIARLETLRMQLNPHFLFNTLNSISALVEKRPRKAISMIAQLSDFLRIPLKDSLAQQSSLGKEMEFIKRYLAIEKLRFGRRLKVMIDVPQSVETILVPTMILQPLVENAVHHGIAQSAGVGSIVIFAKKSEGRLIIDVNNTYRNGEEMMIRERIGLTNTRERLKQLFGDTASVEISAHERMISVKLILPIE